MALIRLLFGVIVVKIYIFRFWVYNEEVKKQTNKQKNWLSDKTFSVTFTYCQGKGHDFDWSFSPFQTVCCIDMKAKVYFEGYSRYILIYSSITTIVVISFETDRLLYSENTYIFNWRHHFKCDNVWRKISNFCRKSFYKNIFY